MLLYNNEVACHSSSVCVCNGKLVNGTANCVPYRMLAFLLLEEHCVSIAMSIGIITILKKFFPSSTLSMEPCLLVSVN